MGKFDIDTIRAIMAGSNAQEKIAMLDTVYYHIDEWDIFPISIFMCGLNDINTDVRCATLAMLSNYSHKMSQAELLQALSLIEDCDDKIRLLLVDRFYAIVSELDDDSLRSFLPYLWHTKETIRDAAIEMLMDFASDFTNEMFQDIANAYSCSNMKVRESISEFLERNGQEHLISLM